MDFKVCTACSLAKPITKFPSKGKHTLPNGERFTYRGSICRPCIREEHKRNGICVHCHRPAIENNRCCEKHAQLMRDSVKRRNIKDKELVFNHYGCCCAYCGDIRLLFLTIDHINDDGAEHRRLQRSGNNHGHNIYAWLRKNKYPTGFQTLCYNCNCTKTKIGTEALLEYLRCTSLKK